MKSGDDTANTGSPHNVPKTIRTDTIGKHTLRLVSTGKAHAGLLITGGKQIERVDGEDAEAVWFKLKTLVGKNSEAYFGFDGAIPRFRRFFPDGFQSPDFEQRERQYKLDAKQKLDETVPLDEALTGSGHGLAVLSAFRSTNLLSPFEKTRLQSLLRSADADIFIQAAARFAMGDIKPALAAMEPALARHDCDKWTVVTYLPFLWRPDTHMFLKPAVTGEFAGCVGHPFAYEYRPALDAEIYSSLLDLMDTTRKAVQTLEPRDNIDLQSFVWVVGEYRDGDETPVEA